MQKSYSLSFAQMAAIAGVLFFIALVLGTVLYLRSRKKKSKERAAQFSGLSVDTSLINDQSMSSSFVLGVIENGVVMIKADHTIQLFNPAASRLTGWPSEEAVGLDVQNVIKLTRNGGRAIEPADNPFLKAMETKASIKDSELWLTSRSGKTIPISLIVSPVMDKSGQTAKSAVGVFSDIIKEKEEEARRTEFISTASHEMRTPIAAIEGYLALAMNEKVATIDTNARKYLVKASDSTKHLGALFADLLTSSKAEDGRLANYPVVVEAGELVSKVAEAGRFIAKEKGLDLRYIVSTDQQRANAQVMRPLYYIFIDPNRFTEVIQNLVDNAIKYTQEGTVTVRLTADTDVVQIQVQDTGAGISADDIPHLFQKFYRVDNSMTRTIGGTGLGLFICRRIIEMNNGRIWAESQPGKGSTFFINLPRLSAEKALELQKQQAAQISPLDVRQ